MSKLPRIAVTNLNKEFRIYKRPQDRLIELISRKPKHMLFKVLTDISFAVAEGKSFGIIGNNGAGNKGAGNRGAGKGGGFGALRLKPAKVIVRRNMTSAPA